MKRLIRLACLLMVFVLLPVQAFASFADRAQRREMLDKLAQESRMKYKDQVELWEESDGIGYARWEKCSGDRIKFRPKLYNHSEVRTVKPVELYYYATDVWGDLVYGEDTHYCQKLGGLHAAQRTRKSPPNNLNTLPATRAVRGPEKHTISTLSELW